MSSKEINLINKHPLHIWQSQIVTNLLVDFYEGNYKLAGVPESVAKNFVLKAWEKKDNTNINILLKECGDEQLKIQRVMKKIQDRESDPLDIINFNEVKIFLDIGANKLSAINFLGKKYKHIEKFIGIDVIPQYTDFMFPEKSEYHQVNPSDATYPITNASVDLILIQYAFHHFPTANAIKTCLNNCYKVLKPGGRLLLMEESFTEKFNFFDVETNNKKYNIKTNKELTERFYNLQDSQKWEFILANDWLISLSNPHMQWSGQYRTWENWVSLLKQHNLYLNQTHNLGLRLNGRLKQGVHIIGVFNKI
jgi:SAM-dependent methyltransferase